MSEKSFANVRKVLVTGGAKGNGLAITEKFLRCGDSVVVIDKNSSVELEELSRVFQGSLLVYSEDVSTLNSVKLSTMFGGVYFDVAVLNAGIASSNASVAIDNFDSVLAINLRASYVLADFFVSGMRERKFGRLIFISSISGHLGSLGNAAYHASKAGVEGLSKSFAADNGVFGITSNCVCPGYIRTSMTEASYSDFDRRTYIESLTMLGRWGQPSDVANACEFLAGSGAEYITGSTIFVDGGLVHAGVMG